MRVRRSRGKVDTYMITIELPWPDKRLNPNSKNRWAKTKATKQARYDAYYITREVVGPYIHNAVPIGYKTQYIFYPPDRRHRDKDNCLAMMKASQDGVADALGINDKYFVPEKPKWGDITPGGKVVLTLEEMNED